MSKPFRVKHRLYFPAWLLLAAVCCLGCVLFELYRIVLPFHSENPLWHQVTDNQPVIDDWMYGGQNEVGYLRFYNARTGQSVVLPPGTHTFDADGKFVVIEQFSPSSLTFAKPYEAIPAKWMLTFMGAISLIIGLVAWRVKRFHKVRTQTFTHRTTAGQKIVSKWNQPRERRTRRFKSKRKFL